MSMGKTLDDGLVSVFKNKGINVFKKEDMFITNDRQRQNLSSCAGPATCC
jgi:hypothetical protein